MKKLLSILALVSVVAYAATSGTYIKPPALYETPTSTAATGGVTSMSFASESNQILTGTTTHTHQLASAATYQNIGRYFDFYNRSTGDWTILTSDGATLTTIKPGFQKKIRLTSVGTAPGSWVVQGSTFLELTGGTLTGVLGLDYSGVLPTTVLTINASRQVQSSNVTPTELGRLAGVSANVQTQLNAKASTTDLAAYLPIAGGTMGGDFGLNGSGTSPATVLTMNASRVVQSSSVTPTELGYLSGVTANIQQQINTLAGATVGANFVAKSGDTMTGALNVGATVSAITLNATGLTANRAIATDASKNLVTTAVTDTELGYMAGTTAAVQGQVDAKLPLAGGTITGNITFSGANPNIRTTTSIRQEFLGVTTNPVGMFAGTSSDGAHVNYAFGDAIAFNTLSNSIGLRFARTQDAQSSFEAINNSTGSSASASLRATSNAGAVALTSYSAAAGGYGAIEAPAGVTGGVRLLIPGVTASTVTTLDANRRIVSSNVSDTELGYVDGVTAAIQTQINAKPVFTAWASCTTSGTWTTNTTYTCFMRRVGDTMEVSIQVNVSGGNPNSATLTVNIPNSETVNTAVLAGTEPVVGQCNAVDSGSTNYPGCTAILNSSTTLAFRTHRTVSGSNPVFIDGPAINETRPFIFGGSDVVNIRASFPIVGW